MKNEKSLVSIVIPTHNRKKSVERLINSIYNNTYKNVEIITVDDASSDGTSDHLRAKFGKNANFILLRNHKNLFAAGSKNVGMKKSKGKYIFFADDDNVMSKNLISTLAAVLDSDPSIGEVGPIMYFLSRPKKLYWAGTNRNLTTTRTYFRTSLRGIGSKKTWITDDVLNAFMVRGDVVRKNKIFFRDNYGIMYEESDYAYRIRNAGFSVVTVKDAVIYHDVDVNTSKKYRTAFLYHTMNDIRRPYFTARNRLIFHSIYSTRLQVLGIITLWNWLFAGYYIFNILFYSGPGEFNPLARIKLAYSYIQGVLEGLKYVFYKKLNK